MSEAIAIGLDIAKHVFLAQGSDAAGRAVFSRRLTRGKLQRLHFGYRHWLDVGYGRSKSRGSWR